MGRSSLSARPASVAFERAGGRAPPAPRYTLSVTGFPASRSATLVVCLVALSLVSVAASPRAESSDPMTHARRIVSMNPSLTEILIALDAESSLVGVDVYSKKVSPEVSELPTVGGLFNPSLEAVVSLEPDLVVLVPSAQQRGFVDRLEALDIDVLVLANITLDEIFKSIEVIGERVGRAASAVRLVTRIRESWDEVGAALAGRARQRTVLVIQREPLYVVGGGSFIDAMLTAAGADNAARGFDEPYPRVAVEWLIAAAPDVILDADTTGPDPYAYWSRWPSIPAVANRRVVAVSAAAITLPGPKLDRAVRILAAAIHPDVALGGVADRSDVTGHAVAVGQNDAGGSAP